jgi:hypothetical protein
MTLAAGGTKAHSASGKNFGKTDGARKPERPKTYLWVILFLSR